MIVRSTSYGKYHPAIVVAEAAPDQSLVVTSFLAGAFPYPRYSGVRTPLISGDGRAVIQGFAEPSSSSLNWLRMELDPRRVCRADFNGDRVVDDSDFGVFVQSMELVDQPFIDDRCDMNNDMMVEGADFVLFALAYEDVICP